MVISGVEIDQLDISEGVYVGSMGVSVGVDMLGCDGKRELLNVDVKMGRGG